MSYSQFLGLLMAITFTHIPWSETMTHQKYGLGFGRAKLLQRCLCIVRLLAHENIKVDLTHKILIHCARAYTAVPVIPGSHTFSCKAFPGLQLVSKVIHNQFIKKIFLLLSRRYEWQRYLEKKLLQSQ